jgi:hypothetical protein
VRRVESVHHLLQLHDVEFVEAAYHALLRRAPEPSALDLNTRLLREGHDKEALLYGLAISEEAARRPSELHDLPPFLHLHRRLRTSRLAPLLKLVYLFRRQRMQMNRIENALGRLQAAAASGRVNGGDATQTLAYASIKSPRAREIFRKLSRATSA